MTDDKNKHEPRVFYLDLSNTGAAAGKITEALKHLEGKWYAGPHYDVVYYSADQHYRIYNHGQHEKPVIVFTEPGDVAAFFLQWVIDA